MLYGASTPRFYCLFRCFGVILASTNTLYLFRFLRILNAYSCLCLRRISSMNSFVCCGCAYVIFPQPYSITMWRAVNNVPRTARAAIISLTAIVMLFPSLPRTITRFPSAVNVYVVCTKRSTPAAPSNRHTKPSAGVIPLRTRKHHRATTANNTIVAMPCMLTL